MHFCATITLAYIAFTPELRRWFGPTFRFPLMPLLGWGLFIAFLGITSCSVALREWRPIGWISAIVFGFLILAVSIERFAGLLANNPSPEVIR